MSFNDMLKKAFAPGSDEFLAALREKGRADAAQWAAQSGLMDHVAKKRGVELRVGVASIRTL